MGQLYNRIVFGALSPKDPSTNKDGSEWDGWPSVYSGDLASGYEADPFYIGFIVACEIDASAPGMPNRKALPLADLLKVATEDDPAALSNAQAYWADFRKWAIEEYGIDHGPGELLWVNDWD